MKLKRIGVECLVVVTILAGYRWNEAQSGSAKDIAQPTANASSDAVPQAGSITASDALAQSAPPADDGKLRIIIFGAHPDDAEYKNGGTAAMWAAQGHHVKLVSVTNGDIGHWQMAGGPLAQRRTAEAAAADAILGCTSQVLDIHDGELLPTLEHRQTLCRLIREWRADIVIAHRPWDYHPDHRYVGVLVQDAAFMVTVPFFCPDTPFLKNNPVFLYSSDGFLKPYPFAPDIVVAVDDVFEQKLDAIEALESQAYEGGASGSEEHMAEVPPASQPELRRAWLAGALATPTGANCRPVSGGPHHSVR